MHVIAAWVASSSWSDTAAAWAWRASWQGGLLVLLVLALRWMLGRRIPAGWWCLAWVVVGVRFAVPVLPASAWSVFNLAERSRATAPADAGSPRVAVFVPATPADGPSPSVATPAPAADVAHIPPAPPTRAAAAQAPAAPAFPLTRMLLLTWCAGVVVLVIRRAVMELAFARRVRGMPEVGDARVLDVVRACAAETGVARLPRVVETADLRSPAVCGVWRATIVLPAGMAQLVGAQELRMIVLHELAHVRRRDVLAEKLMGLARDLHWPNPLAWLWLRAWRRDRELACDEAVLRLVGARATKQYGSCLLKVLEAVRGLPPAPAAVGIFERGGGIRRRIDMIAHFDGAPRRSGRVAGAAIVGCLALAGLTDCARPADADKPPATQRPQPADRAAVQDAVRRARALVEQAKYAEALAVVNNEILKTDPENDYGQGVRPLLEDKVRLAAERDEVDRGKKAMLERHLPEVMFDGIAFSDVIDFLRDVTAVNIFVDWRSLEAAGIERNAPVTARLRDVEFGKALEVILASLAVDPQLRPTFTIDRGVLSIFVPLPADAGAAGTTTPAATASPASRPQAGAVDDPVLRARLEKKLPQVVFAGLGLSDVMDYLRDITAANIHVQWHELEAAGIDRNTPIEVRLKDVTLDKALDVVLAAAGGSNVQLGYTAEAGVITVGVVRPPTGAPATRPATRPTPTVGRPK